MGRSRKPTEHQLRKLKQWVRLTAKIGSMKQLSNRLGLSLPTTSRYVRAIKYGVVDQPFNHNGYLLNKQRTGYIGAKPRKKRKHDSTLPTARCTLDTYVRTHFTGGADI